MERMFKQDGNLVIHKQTDPTPVLEHVAQQREAQETTFAADWRHVGTLDKHVVEMWVKKAGVKWTDRAAVREVIKKNLMDSDNAAFRVWEGRY